MVFAVPSAQGAPQRKSLSVPGLSSLNLVHRILVSLDDSVGSFRPPQHKLESQTFQDLPGATAEAALDPVFVEGN